MRVEFSHFDIPANLPSKVSLALFRVAPGAIYLTVTDAGTGFDPVEAMGSRGLGLISMRERLQLANGSMSIESVPRQGTIIRARVPFHVDAESSEPQRMTR